jgi:hypothetical protein
MLLSRFPVMEIWFIFLRLSCNQLSEVLLIDYYPRRQRAINRRILSYAKLISKVGDAIKKKMGNLRRGMLFHQDSALLTENCIFVAAIYNRVFKIFVRSIIPKHKRVFYMRDNK